MKKQFVAAAVFVLLVSCCLICHGEEGDNNTQVQPSETKDKKPPFIFLDPQKLVKVHIKNKWVEIPAASQVAGGMVELALCTLGAPNCRPHETMFVTWAKPSLVHAGLQIIGLKPGKPVKFDGQSKLPSGDGLYIYVVWKEKDKDKEILKFSRLENLIYNNLIEEPVTDIKWIFTGSRFAKVKAAPDEEDKKENGDNDNKTDKNAKMKVVYEADIDGTIIATWHWTVTVIDIPMPEGSNDEAFDAYRKNMPKRETPVRFLFSGTEISEKTIRKEFASQTFTFPKEKEEKKEEEKKEDDDFLDKL